MNLDAMQLEQVKKLYEEYSVHVCSNLDLNKFIKDYIGVCECCNNACYYDELVPTEMWNGKIVDCCIECRKVVDEER